jgi:beta-glucoside PTS system EIICBA component
VQNKIVRVFVLGFEDPVEEKLNNESENTQNKPEAVSSSIIVSEQVINSPINGKVIDLKEVGDGVFSEGLLGKGVAIIPSEEKVYAPENGVMSTVFRTKNAYVITTSNGAEILIHIGINTVELQGESYL